MAPVYGDKVTSALFVLMFVLILLVRESAAVLRYDRDELLRMNDLFVDYDLQKEGRSDIFLSTVERTHIRNRPTRDSHYKARAVRKRGKRSGALVRFRKRPQRPPLPFILLSNVRSLCNKRDELLWNMNNRRNYGECSLICFTETWLHKTISDNGFLLDGFTLHRADRSPELSEKERGGGVCFYVNHRWCSDSTVLSRSCSPDIETLAIKCVPFYLPREFPSLVIVGVYIHPEANAKTAINTLAELIRSLERKHPDSHFIILGDFNHTSLTKEIPKFRQHVKCPTREDKILDHCYTTISGAYHAISRAPLGLSDHNTVFLFPAYKSKLKTNKPLIRTVKRWDTESVEKLKACLECTEWSVFQDSSTDIDELTDVVTSYISFCQDICIPSRQVKIFSNNKPWFTPHIRNKMAEKHKAYKDGDKVSYKKAKYNVQKAIRAAKIDYRKKLESQFLSGDTRTVWQGLQTVTDYKKRCSVSSHSDPELAEKLNHFYARFDHQNLVQPSTQFLSPTLPPPLVIEEEEVRKLFLLQNRWKAAGPDHISPATLRFCADQLAPIFTNIFNSSLKLSVIPRCFKTSLIIPVPKKPKITSLNDYRPVALTSVVMKVFERIVLKCIKSLTDSQLDTFQFAYRENRSAEDAVSLVTHHILQHLDTPKRYARILFLDFSSAFNTIVPQKLFEKLQNLPIPSSLSHWILNFLLDRPQAVRINNIQSSTLVLNTGAPQGCVLSPVLFSLFTNDCVSHSPSVYFIKFADDTTVEGLIEGSDETDYRREVNTLVDWCDKNNLHLNATKTKELIIDFRRIKQPITPLHIKGSKIEIVDSIKFLGTHISSTLCWELNVNNIILKAQQRMFFLRQLKKFGLRREILVSFYRAVIESVLTSSLCTWYGSTTVDQRKHLQRVVRQAERITCATLPSLQEIYDKRAVKRCKKIMGDPAHPAHNLYQLLPSGKRLRTAMARTNRLKNSFYLKSISLFNSKL